MVGHQTTIWMLASLMSCGVDPATTTGEDTSAGGTGEDVETGLADSGTTAGEETGDSGTAEPLDCADAGPEHPCCRDASSALYICIEELDGGSVEGEFLRWGYLGPVRFRTTDGQLLEFEVGGDEESLAEVADLAAAGQVKVSLQGGCGYDAMHAAVSVTDSATGGLLLSTGIDEAVDLDGLTVRAASDSATCPGREDQSMCWEFMHNMPVEFSSGAGVAEVYQGGESTLDGNRVRVASAQTGSGEWQCDDGSSADRLNWWVVPE